jgi:hypothetical protein
VDFCVSRVAERHNQAVIEQRAGAFLTASSSTRKSPNRRRCSGSRHGSDQRKAVYRITRTDTTLPSPRGRLYF